MKQRLLLDYNQIFGAWNNGHLVTKDNYEHYYNMLNDNVCIVQCSNNMFDEEFVIDEDNYVLMKTQLRQSTGAKTFHIVNGERISKNLCDMLIFDLTNFNDLERWAVNLK